MLPARHVHLDFHTSELCTDVGREFDPRQMARALRLGHVNAITLFGLCHHGWSYYPTKVGKPHPHLARPALLDEQLAVCRRLGVRAPVYFTIGWNARAAREHPEWVVRTRDGRVDCMASAWGWKPDAKPDEPMPGFSWPYLCVFGGYADFLCELVAEFCAARDHVDGFFFDITNARRSYRPECLAAMRDEGVDIDDPAAAERWYVGVWTAFMRRIRAIIAERHPHATVFFNGRAEMDTPPEHLAQQTHYELEDLPTAWGGYDKFPPRARFFSRQTKPFMAMSGKFHHSWGEFGGFKAPEAIRYEASAMLAFGASCSFGDQLHPSGRFDLETYRRLGEAYTHVERVEPWFHDAQPVARLGVMFTGGAESGRSLNDQGVVQMLLEGGRDFRVVLPQDEDFNGFDTLILTGDACLDADSAARLHAFVARGGSLLVLARSFLSASTPHTPVLDVGVEWIGDLATDVDFIAAGPALRTGLVASPFLSNHAAVRTKPRAGTRTLARVHTPAFSRTYGTYCGHQHWPHQLAPAEHPAATRRGRILYLAHELGRIYQQRGARLHRDYFLNALALIDRRPVVETTLPSAGRVSLMHQPEHRRYVLHLLYAAPMRRGDCHVIEDLPRIDDIAVTLRLPEKITSVRLPLERRKLTARVSDGALRFTVPSLQSHALVELSYR